LFTDDVVTDAAATDVIDAAIRHHHRQQQQQQQPVNRGPVASISGRVDRLIFIPSGKIATAAAAYWR